jgi:hypothetical protein
MRGRGACRTRLERSYSPNVKGEWWTQTEDKCQGRHHAPVMCARPRDGWACGTVSYAQCGDEQEQNADKTR